MRTPHHRMVNGLAVHDYPAKSADAPTVVMLPSLAQSRRSWTGVAGRVDPRVRCLAVDIPGQGDSGYPARFLSIFDLADEVASVLRAEGVDRVDVVGNSLGAVVGSQLALAEPGLVGALVLVGAPVWADEPARREWLHSRSEMLLDGDGWPRETPREAVVSLFGEYDPDFHQLMREDAQKSGRALAWTLWALYAYEYAQKLASVAQPVLAVYGSRDWLKDLSLPTLEEAVAQLTVRIVDDGSHLLPLDKPAELAELITEWVRRS